MARYPFPCSKDVAQLTFDRCESMRIRMLVLLAALLFLATGIVSCQQNFAQIGGYQISVGSIPYGGTVNGNMLGGISSTVSWSIMIQPRSENLNDMAYRILADGKYTEQESIGTFPVTIDGKEGAYAIGVADLNILNTQSGLLNPPQRRNTRRCTISMIRWIVRSMFLVRRHYSKIS